MNKWFSESIKFIKKYSSRSIFYKYLKMLAAILFIPFIILNVIIFSFYSGATEKEIQSSLSESFSKSANIFEIVFSTVENNHLLCVNNEYILSYMFMTKPDFTATHRTTIHHITDVLSYMKNSSPYMDSIYLYSPESNYLLSDKSGNYLSEIEDISWYEYYQENKNCQKFIIKRKNHTQTEMLSFGYELYYNKDIIGVIVFNINLDMLSQLALGSDSNKETTYIIDDNQNVVFASYDSQPSFDIENYIQFPYDHINFEKNEQQYTFAKRINDSEYMIVSEYDMSILRSTNKRAHFVLVFLILLSVLLSFIIAMYMSFQFYNSISTIMASFHTIGITNPEELNDKYDEIKFITENIIQNSISKAQIEQELSQKMLHLQKAQTIALQTQFTPHFLFNTLNHISVTLMNTIGRNNTASQMITILADLLTIALDTKEYITNIKNETIYAKKYIELEQIKHDNNFDVTWDIDESLFEYATPKLILQPILENSFKHGINPLRSKRKGKIDISVQRDSNDIIFKIADNGVGISNERLNQIRSHLKANDIPETRHIGLCNVHQRINLIFKENYGCKIYSTNPGVTVEIHIPCRKLNKSSITQRDNTF